MQRSSLNGHTRFRYSNQSSNLAIRLAELALQGVTSGISRC